MARPCGSGNGVTGATKLSYFQTFQNKMETAQLSRPTWRRRDFKKVFQVFLDRGGDGATFATKVDTARLRKRRDSKGNGVTGLASATKMCTFKTFATEMETERLCRPKRRRRDFSDQCGDGATFQTEVETARPRLYSSRLRWIRCDFPDQGGDGATFQTKAERALFSRPSRRRRDQEVISRYQGGGGATFQTKAETVRLFRPMRRRHDFSDQGRDGETFQTEVGTARLSRPRWRPSNLEQTGNVNEEANKTRSSNNE